MGPSGAGKSTLLHVIGMHDTAWTGEYDLLDFPIHKLRKKDRDEMYKKYFGFVFQSYHLLDSLTVYENLEIPLVLSQREKVGARRDRVRRARPLSDRRQEGPVPESAFRRPAATGGHRARHRGQPEGDSGR